MRAINTINLSKKIFFFLIVWTIKRMCGTCELRMMYKIIFDILNKEEKLFTKKINSVVDLTELNIYSNSRGG